MYLKKYKTIEMLVVFLIIFSNMCCATDIPIWNQSTLLDSITVSNNIENSTSKEGNFLGKLVSTNQANNTSTYELKLPTDAMFSKVHGDIKLYYTVYNKDKIVMLDKFEPIEILSEGHASELVTYKGVMVSKQHAEKDMFKINLLNMIQK